MKIEAKIVADSVSEAGIRLTTMSLSYPRFIHSELMTHRMFSRNASSSRAIPVKKMLEQVRNNPAIPIHWGRNQPGMQAREGHNNPGKGIEEWFNAAAQAARYADKLRHHGFHKQIVNRILEPFQMMNTVVTATEWDNFFFLRIHPDAQPEIRELAHCMKEAMNNSVPKILEYGMWHTPYWDDLCVWEEGTAPNCIKASVARCARVSYKNHDGSSPDKTKDMALHDMLLKSRHMSPFEHVATPLTNPDNFHAGDVWEKGVTHIDKNGTVWSGNFRGWAQYRQLLEN